MYESPTGPIWPKVAVGGIEDAAPDRSNYFPGICNIYVDVHMPPQVRPVRQPTRTEAQAQRARHRL